MIAEQLDLFATRVSSAEADGLVLERWLYLQGGWRTRREISDALGWRDHARIRHAAEAASGDVIFGQRGMRHLRNSSPEEVAICIATLESQVESLQRRIMATRKKFHAYGEGKPAP